MKNNSSPNRFARITAKLTVVLLAAVLCLSVLPTFSGDIFPEAYAAEESYSVQSGTAVATINSKLASYAEGTVVNMTLLGNIDFTDTSSAQYSSGITGIVIPKGITVNLFMNGKSITFARNSGGAWQLPYVYGIHNKGTLNVYSGSSVTATSTTASITVMNLRSDMTADMDPGSAYVGLEGIRNEGNLSVNSKVSITVGAQTDYNDAKGSGTSINVNYREQATDSAAGIVNVSGASCSVNGASVTVATISRVAYRVTKQSNDYRVNATAVGYGIYGGNVTVSGGTTIAVNSYAKAKRLTCTGAEKGDGRSFITGIAYGVATTGSVTVTGADISAMVDASTDKGTTDSSSEVNQYAGGILTLTGNTPTVPDANITVNTSSYSKSDDDDRSSPTIYSEGTVVRAASLPKNPTDTVSDNINWNPLYTTRYKETVQAGTFLDEAGNGYSTDIATSAGNHPTSIKRGAVGDVNRVHIVYRYWVDQNRSNIDTTIVGTDGNVGYSYAPLTDNTGVVEKLVSLSGVSSTTNLTKTSSAAIKYVSGGESCNSYYWRLIDIAYEKTSAWFSDYVVTSNANRGSQFKTFTAQGAQDGSVPAENAPVYIFVDYARLDPTNIKAKVGTSNVATAVYTGSPIKASALGLKIVDSVYETDYTSEYNIDFTSDDLIRVSYSYEGTNTAGVKETSESGQLPTNAGTYTVTLTITESVTYDKNPKINKNRYALEYKFTLVIEQASILRGNLPTSVDLTYGQKLNEVLLLSNFTAQGIAEDTNISGVFSFTNASDGSSYKNVGTQTVSITWSPAYSAASNVKNYKTTTFNVEYTVKKAPLTIRPNVAAVTYGNSEFETPFSVTITGLVGNDMNESSRTQVANALSYMILSGDSYIPYVAGEIGVGSYYIRATFTDVPAILSNYEYSHVYGAENNAEGVLTVSKRALTVEATAKDREYAPDNYSVDVSFTITDGKFGVDDVRIDTVAGALSDNTAGTKEVSGVTKQTVADKILGGSGKNYYVADVVYKTGNSLLVTIKKGVPNVTVPVIAEMFYQRARTLKDIALEGYTSSVSGSWQWVDTTVNPTVAVSTYKAMFVPSDTDNYEIKYEDIAVNVKATPVVISYAGTVSYGGNIPNITAYSYKADLDPTFNIDSVTTSGNITPYTDYVKGSPVKDGGYKVEIVAPNFVDVNGNYTFSTSDGVITVTPRVITFKVQDATVEYGENFVPNADSVKVSYDEASLVGDDTIENVTASGNAPTFTYSTDFRYLDNYGVGTYYIDATAAFTTSANYTVKTERGTLRVTKAPLVIKAKDVTLEYGSAVPDDISASFEVVGAKRNETVEDILSSGSIKVDTTYEKNSPVNTDGYPITVDIASASFDNYTVSVQHGTITVVKATPKITTLPTASIVYGQTLADAVFKGGKVENGVSGKYLYDAASTAPAYKADAYTIYTAAFIPNDTQNYNTVTGLYVSLTVGLKPVSGELAVSGIPMVGEKLTVDVTGLDPDTLGVYTITWYANNSVIGTGESVTLTDAQKLQVVTVIATANTPYKGSVEYKTTQIAPELTSVETVLTEEEFARYFVLSGLSDYQGETSYVYNAQPHNITFGRNENSLSSAAIGGITVKYNGSTTAPTTVGYYTVTIDIATPADVDLTSHTYVDGITTVNGKAVYSPIANYKIGTLIITKAPYNVTVEILDKVYDGTSEATAKVLSQSGACVLTGGAYDDVSFDEASAVYYFTQNNVGNGINANVTNAFLKGTKADNYELNVTLANDGKADITKRTLKVKVVPVEREYEADNYYVDLSFEPVANTLASGDDGFVFVNEALVQGAVDNYRAGLRNVSVSGAVLAGAKADNYTLELTNLDGLTVRILKATPSYPIPYVDTLHYDSAKTLSLISLGDSRWAWDASVANEVPGAGNHSYKAVYTPDDTLNYATVEYDVEFEVLKTKVTVTAADFTVVYGDIEPTYYYNVVGLTGADTIKNVDGYVLMKCSYSAGSAVGKYDIVLTGAFESDNYDFVYKNGSVTVNKRAAYVEAIAEDREYEAGNLDVNVTFSSLSNLYGTDNAKDVFLAGSFPIVGTVENENAGIKNVSYTMPVLAGAKSGNYELRLLNTTLTVEIKKARTPGVVLPQSGKVGYGQKLSNTVFTSSYEGSEYGTFSMENPTTTPTKVGTFSDVYKVVFTPYNTQNYAVMTDYIVLTVEPSQLNISISFAGTAQSGKSLYVVTNSLPAGAEEYLYFEWYRVDSPDEDPRNGYRVASGTDYYTLTDSDSGKYIMCTVTNLDDAPYTCSAKCVTDSEVQEVQLSFWQKLMNWFYRIIASLTQIFGKI